MEIIDLSITIKNNMKVYPGDPEVSITNIESNDIFNVSKLTFGTHTGTHVDAFSHIDQSKESIDKIPIENFVGKSHLVKKEDIFPRNNGLIFNEFIDIEIFEKLIESNPKFVGGNISEELEIKLLQNNIITFTDLINLELLPYNKEFLFIGLPLKIQNGDGSPIRAIAILD